MGRAGYIITTNCQVFPTTGNRQPGSPINTTLYRSQPLVDFKANRPPSLSSRRNWIFNHIGCTRSADNGPGSRPDIISIIRGAQCKSGSRRGALWFWFHDTGASKGPLGWARCANSQTCFFWVFLVENDLFSNRRCPCPDQWLISLLTHGCVPMPTGMKSVLMHAYCDDLIWLTLTISYPTWWTHGNKTDQYHRLVYFFYEIKRNISGTPSSLWC